jgi:hypothetical protein
MNRIARSVPVVLATLALAGVVHASPLRRMLRDQVVAAIRTADQVFRGASPTASGQVACATGSDVAGWSTPASCGLATGTNYWAQASGVLSPSGITAPQDIEMSPASSSTSTPSIFGWKGMTTGQAVQFLLGDTNSGIQNGNGDVVQFFAYHTIELWGNTQGSVPAFSSADHGSVEIYGIPTANGGAALTISKVVSGTPNVVTHGTAITFSGRATASRASASIAANTCAQATATLTGVNAGTDCRAGLGAASTLNIQTTCQYDGTNAVRWLMCNPTTAAITFPASGTLTLSCRCENP